MRDSDTVVFLGDSIIAARTYGKIVESYTLLRFPGRKVRFIDSGWGVAAAGGLKRLARDVFAHGATALIVAYRVIDIDWGLKAGRNTSEPTSTAFAWSRSVLRVERTRLGWAPG